MDKIFNPSKFEDHIFKFWIESKLFHKINNDKIKYSFILPPPNIAGVLHLGHAWDGTIIHHKANENIIYKGVIDTINSFIQI